MSSNCTHRIQIAVIVLVILVLMLSMLCMCGCCRKQYTQHTSSVVMQEQKTIDTYLFKGVKHYVFDTTVIVVDQSTGDTISKDHRIDSRYYQEKDREQETNEINKNDSIIYQTQTIIENKLNKTQYFFYLTGIFSILLVISYIIYKLFNLFKR